MYKLVTHGVGRLGKGAIIFGEAAADVYTLGLFEVIATPAEGATASAPHTVMFCYLPDATLDYITDSGPNGVVTVVGDSTRHGAPQAIAATNVTPQATNSSAPLAPPTITANTPASPAPSAAPPSPAAPALSSPAPAAAAPARGPAAKAALLTPAQASSYKLQPGDRLLISTLNEPQNTGTFTVNDKGTIAMEYIGDVPAGGHTASELQSEITKKLGYGFEANPQVSVAVVAPDPARLVSN
ncbi:MAG: polysaccharide biosynthesis/export family protein [Caulobacteraceae bacterium]|nr:polysaccharide biosynthesis/export family protein [Caulobacteraceae bacterium]